MVLFFFGGGMGRVDAFYFRFFWLGGGGGVVGFKKGCGGFASLRGSLAPPPRRRRCLIFGVDSGLVYLFFWGGLIVVLGFGVCGCWVGRFDPGWAAVPTPTQTVERHRQDPKNKCTTGKECVVSCHMYLDRQTETVC